MAVGLGPLPEFFPVPGIRIGVACAGIKKPGRKDLVVFELAEGSHVGAVFTQNQFCAAPVVVARRHLGQARPRYLLINTGNANAGTGPQGLKDASACCEQLASLTDCDPEAVLPFSTGVIGEPLPVSVITSGLPQAVQALSEQGWGDAAEGIMTTDTLPKGASLRLELDGHPVHLSGISKGAGMIRPNMATMLGFVATDARIAPDLVQELVAQVSELSFNRISVDGDTSTNDACVLVATGQSPAPVINRNSPHLPRFREALMTLFAQLAQAIVRDAEGATKFVTVQVTGAANTQDALKVGYAVAESPLVKTALFASDPNWGRILAAVGRAGVASLDVNRVAIDLGDVAIVRDGSRATDYTEARGQAVMDQAEITIRIDLGMGTSQETLWTSDFSHEYVRINAEYRT